MISYCSFLSQDGRADVVANDAGDRVTPAVVAYRETEQVIIIITKKTALTDTFIFVQDCYSLSFKRAPESDKVTGQAFRVSLDLVGESS